MRIILGAFVLAVGVGLFTPAVSSAQETPYTFVLRGVALNQALETFSQTTGVAVAYAPHLARNREVYCVARDEPAEAVLQCILQETGLDFYRLSSGTYVLTAPAEIAPARGYLTGVVADGDTGAPIPQAHVQLADAGSGTTTGPSGRFTLPPLLPGEYVVHISHVGYRTWRDTLRVTPDGRTRTEAVLHPEPVAVEPVVIDGIQSRRSEASLGRAELDQDDPLVGWAGGSHQTMRQLNTLSGVRVNDLTADVHLQGGRPGDHEMRLDGVPVYLPRTLAGLIGPFSSFAIDRITVEKAGFGAATGSQLGGVINARHALATTHRADVQADPLSLNARLQLTPSVARTERVAVMTAGRMSLSPQYAPDPLRNTLGGWSRLDPFLLAALATDASDQIASDAARATTTGSAPHPRYSDIHAAGRVQLNPLHTLNISAYRGTRRLTGRAWNTPTGTTAESSAGLLTTDDDYHWQNLLGQIQYDAVLGRRTLMRVQARSSRYRLDHSYSTIDSLVIQTDNGTPRLDEETLVPLHDGNRIRTTSLDGSIDHARGAHHLQAGTELTWTESAFTLNGVRLASSRFDNTVSNEMPSFATASAAPHIMHTASQVRLAAFAQDRIDLGARWDTEVGVRLEGGSFHAPESDDGKPAIVNGWCRRAPTISPMRCFFSRAHAGGCAPKDSTSTNRVT